MRRYSQKVREAILPLSVADSLPDAFGEWSVTGNIIDSGETVEPCRLCGQEERRYLFELRNAHTGKTLWADSRCVLKYGIPVLERGVRLAKARAKRKLDDLEQQTRVDSCLRALEKAAKDEENDILRDAVEYYRMNRFLTPRFAFVVFWKLKAHGIDHSPSFFRINVKKARYKRDLSEMETGRVHFFWEALTAGQKKLALAMGHLPPQTAEGKNPLHVPKRRVSRQTEATGDGHV
ncbi:MAG: hypothetical protein ACYC9O_00370 [Candidatus Latescibacterota bacterium]